MDITRMTEAQYFFILGLKENGFRYVVQTSKVHYFTVDAPPEDADIETWIKSQAEDKIATASHGATKFNEIMSDNETIDLIEIIDFCKFFE